ncbi:uncharacterized protein LOC112126651 [Cimex lectularius]|uniref:Pacifastin domain-containing protein n=1 Tax=Cimex lectularius TaxID=79782 RepID=A0A8I6SSU2_CIMLE|nr:uncharacterized protein LOC112126651 [Cimex lectularius]
MPFNLHSTPSVMKISICAVLLAVLCQGVLSGLSRDVIECVPGQLVWVQCNLCTCNRQGIPNQVCAKMWCPPMPKTTTQNSAETDE